MERWFARRAMAKERKSVERCAASEIIARDLEITPPAISILWGCVRGDGTDGGGRGEWTLP